MNKRHDKDHRLGRQRAVTQSLNDLEHQTGRLLELMRKAGSEAEKQAIRDQVQKQVDALEYGHFKTGNPLFCWRALLAIHDFDLSMPEWITTYLYRAGLEIINTAYQDRQKQPIKDTLATALQFDQMGHGGAAGPFKTFIRDMTGLEAVVGHELAGLTATKAAAKAATDLTDTLKKKVDADLTRTRQRRLRYDRRRRCWRSGPGRFTDTDRKKAYRKHGRALPEKIIQAIEAGGDAVDLSERVTSHISKSKSKIQHIR
jgi:hypothetical protein